MYIPSSDPHPGGGVNTSSYTCILSNGADYSCSYSLTSFEVVPQLYGIKSLLLHLALTPLCLFLFGMSPCASMVHTRFRKSVDCATPLSPSTSGQAGSSVGGCPQVVQKNIILQTEQVNASLSFYAYSLRLQQTAAVLASQAQELVLLSKYNQSCTKFTENLRVWIARDKIETFSAYLLILDNVSYENVSE